MMGQAIRGGTAFSQIMLGRPDAREVDGVDQDGESDLSRLDESGMKMMDPCSSTQFPMNVIMPNASTLMKEEDVELHMV